MSTPKRTTRTRPSDRSADDFKALLSTIRGQLFDQMLLQIASDERPPPIFKSLSAHRRRELDYFVRVQLAHGARASNPETARLSRLLARRLRAWATKNPSDAARAETFAIMATPRTPPRTPAESQYVLATVQRLLGRRILRGEVFEAACRRLAAHNWRNAASGGRASANHSDEKIESNLREFRNKNPHLTFTSAVAHLIGTKLPYSDSNKLIKRVKRIAAPQRPSVWYYALK